MSSIELLKEEARRFEQDEQWDKALELYSRAIDQLSDDDRPDIALFNRSGDLATKVGSAAQAVAYYERAVDFYMDAGLPNNAIAVCKKVMRNLPDRNSIYLKMGQIQARQGLITDARTSFVTYAERVQADGDLDEAFRALIEFVNLAPDDYEIAMMLASQLEQNDRKDEALTQYVGAYRSMRRQGLGDLADNVAKQIKTMDPQLNLEKAASDEFFIQPTGLAEGEEGTEEVGAPQRAAEVDIIGPVDLPLMSFDDDEDDAVEAADEAAATKVAEEAAAKAAEEATAKAAEEATARAAEEATARAAEEATASAAEEAAAAKAAEEATASAAEEAAAQAAQEAAAKAADEPASVSTVDPAPEDPASSSGQYVDLGAVLLGEEVHTEKKKSTRFVVPYEEPTGDDQADFEKMLAQFREKVSENIDADDAIAHYDLGTAYMEMGLLDEAISEFQMVLRGTSNHLPTYEMLGKTFLQKEEPEAALRSLSRGLEAPCEVEEDRVGIYYYIGLSHETMGEKDTAMEFFDRVFALDINFADVTERLKALRG